MIVTLSAARTWDRNTQSDTAAGMEAGTPSVVQPLPRGRDQQQYQPVRMPFAGLRKLVEQIVSPLMPGLPTGPAAVIAHRVRPAGAGAAAVMQSQPASNLTAVRSVDQSPPWWEYLQ